MPTRDTAIGAFTTSSACAASTHNEAAGGCIGYEEVIVDSDGTTTTENYVQVADVPVNSSRLIKITGEGTLRATGPSGLQVLLFEDSTQLRRLNFYVHASGTDASFHITALSHAPSTGDHIYTLAGGISGGSGETATLIADTDEIAYLIIEDCGPDFA